MEINPYYNNPLRSRMAGNILRWAFIVGACLVIVSAIAI